MTMVRDMQAASLILGDAETDRIIASGGLSGATPDEARTLVDAARAVVDSARRSVEAGDASPGAAWVIEIWDSRND